MVVDRDRSESLFSRNDFAAILTTPWPFRPVTIMIYLAVTLLPTTASELGRLSEPSLIVAIGVATLSVSVLGLLLFATKILLPARFRSSFPIVLSVLLAVGALRGTIISSFMHLTTLESGSHLASRVFLATFSLPPVLALVSVVVSRVAQSRARAASTQIEISAIEQRRDRILGDIAASDSQLLDQVDRTLRPAVESLSRQISDRPETRGAIAAALHSLANDVIRPLSHTLASSAAPTHPTRFPPAGRAAPTSTPTFRDQVSPTFIGLAVFLGSGTVLLDILPLANAAAASVVSGVVLYAVVRILVAIVGDVTWPTLAVAATNTLVLALAWIPAHLFNQSFLFPDDLVFDAWITSFIALPVLGMLYQLIILGSFSGRNQLARLDNTRRNMAFQLSEARRHAWLRQRHLTHTLHSSVQSRVLAESRLVGSGSGPISSAEQQRSRETLNMVLDTVDDDASVTIDALGGILDMVAFWKGMCEISLTVQPDVLSTVDAETAESVLIVTSEMISNAIRHGTATSMSIEIHRDSPDTIRVHAVNNGRALDEEHRPGLGMSLYDELSTEWQLTPGEPVTVVALIAARGNRFDVTALGKSGRTRKAS
jgi:hypothetical protein